MGSVPENQSHKVNRDTPRNIATSGIVYVGKSRKSSPCFRIGLLRNNGSVYPNDEYSVLAVNGVPFPPACYAGRGQTNAIPFAGDRQEDCELKQKNEEKSIKEQKQGKRG